MQSIKLQLIRCCGVILKVAEGAIAWGSETGFLTQISVRMPKLSQKPGFLAEAEARSRGGLRNRVSYPNLGEDAKIIAETRFLSNNLTKNPIEPFELPPVRLELDFHS